MQNSRPLVESAVSFFCHTVASFELDLDDYWNHDWALCSLLEQVTSELIANAILDSINIVWTLTTQAVFDCTLHDKASLAKKFL
jgi:hypothetical protein